MILMNFMKTTKPKKNNNNNRIISFLPKQMKMKSRIIKQIIKIHIQPKFQIGKKDLKICLIQNNQLFMIKLIKI